MKEIGVDIVPDAASVMLDSTTKPVAIAFRATNDPRYAPRLSAIGWQLTHGNERYFLNCLNKPDEQVQNLVLKLLKKDLIALDLAQFRVLALNTFNMLPILAISAPPTTAHHRKAREHMLSHLAF